MGVLLLAHVINGSVRKALEHPCISDVFSSNNNSKFFSKNPGRSLKECQKGTQLSSQEYDDRQLIHDGDPHIK